MNKSLRTRGKALVVSKGLSCFERGEPPPRFIWSLKKVIQMKKRKSPRELGGERENTLSVKNSRKKRGSKSSAAELPGTLSERVIWVAGKLR